MPGPRYLQAAKIEAANRGFQAAFNSVHETTEDPLRVLAMEILSTSPSEEFDWFGDVPGLSRWRDDRPLSKLRAESMNVPNKDYASGLEVGKNDIADDKLGKIMPRIQTLAAKAKISPGQILGQMVLNGWAGGIVAESDGKSYDGKFFFSAAHTDGDSAAYSNIGTAGLGHDSYFAARVVMQSYMDESGLFNYMVDPDVLIVGPSLARTAKEIVEAENRAVGGSETTTQIQNVQRGSARVLISPTFVGSYAAYWALADLRQAMRPLIFQIRQRVAFEALVTGDQVFMQKKLKYGADARWGFGYGDPHMLWGSNGTT